ncbi:sigma-70 family RNA polymerase sigma factor [Sedimentibacter sp.]|uniref:RNA polymerase sigma factor n=1 Tax=Sedimentibacter sp. TaxID=1960295 RepID=UPI0028B24F06|nr:sigma-70 family RNA polymerase sigma factor [Sedimentibacter sp.]
MELYLLFRAAQSGDEESILKLYDKFLPKIKKCGRNLNYETAETDIVILFLEFIKNTDFSALNSKCDGVVVNYTNKFFINAYLNLLKTHKSKIQYVYLDDENTFINDVPYYDEIDDLENAYLSYLTELQKKIIILKYVYGYSDNEIANSLRISRQAVNRAKNRGLNAIKEAIGDFEIKTGGRYHGR